MSGARAGLPCAHWKGARHALNWWRRRRQKSGSRASPNMTAPRHALLASSWNTVRGTRGATWPASQMETSSSTADKFLNRLVVLTSFISFPSLPKIMFLFSRINGYYLLTHFLPTYYPCNFHFPTIFHFSFPFPPLPYFPIHTAGKGGGSYFFTHCLNFFYYHD